MEKPNPQDSKNTSRQPKRRLIIKKEVTGDQIFDILKNFVLNSAAKAGNKNVISLLSKSGAKFITQVEIKPNPKRLASMDAIVEIYERLGEKK